MPHPTQAIATTVKATGVPSKGFARESALKLTIMSPKRGFEYSDVIVKFTREV
jgi:hypothetical protein